MYAAYTKYRLDFLFEAGTSRGKLQQRDIFLIKIYKDKNDSVYGVGECAPLSGLSQDDVPDFEEKLKECLKKLISHPPDLQSEQHIFGWVKNHVDEKLPSIKFGIEVALLDLLHGGNRQIVDNNWSQHPYQPIPINGLIWMNSLGHMMQQLKEKIEAGFDCIKIKIGAINFEDELSLLKHIRARYSAEKITIRVDANGAFNENNVFFKLEKLAKYEVHSIEQPVKAGQYPLMRKVCQESPVDVALDEELIGIHTWGKRTELLDEIKPSYIILKPTLVGGIASSTEWVKLAEERNIGWWVTSALESNVGLNAIAQLTATYSINMPQGLGTGQLYHNNFDSPMWIKDGKLHYQANGSWDLDIPEI